MSIQHKLILAANHILTDLPTLTSQDGRINSLIHLTPSALTGDITDSFLDALSDYIILPDHALIIARHARPVLLEVMARATSKQYNTTGLESRTLAFARIVTVYPRTLPVVIKYLSSTPDVFSNVTTLTSSTNTNNTDSMLRLRQLAEAVRRLLQANHAIFSILWNWAPIYSLIDTSDPSTRHHARCAIALRSKCTEKEQMKFCDEKMAMNATASNDINQEERIVLEKTYPYVTQDALETVEEEEEDGDVAMNSNVQVLPMFSNCILPDAPLHSSLLNVCGIVLRRSEHRSASNSTTTLGNGASSSSSSSSTTTSSSSIQQLHDTLIETSTSMKNMAAFARAMCGEDPILLDGPPGSGKTSMLRHMAHHLYLPVSTKSERESVHRVYGKHCSLTFLFHLPPSNLFHCFCHVFFHI